MAKYFLFFFVMISINETSFAQKKKGHFPFWKKRLIASFTITNNQACMGGVPAPFIFNNFTTNATSYQWDFGDGTPVFNTTSTAPINYTYTQPGQFVVILTATSAAGCCDKYSLVASVTPTTSNYNAGCCSFTTTYAIDPSDGDYSFDIFTTQIWNPLNTPIRDTIRIHAPAILTITTTVQFGPWGKIIVEPGAILILNNTTFTGLSLCGTMWQGIEVWGTATKTQHPSQFPFQGILAMQSNSKILNAHNAVTLGKFCNRFMPNQCNEQVPNTICNRGGIYDFDFSGGIEVAQNSVFQNNAHNIRIAPYQFPQASDIRNCTFAGGISLDPGYRIGSGVPYQYPSPTNPFYAQANPTGRTSRFAHIWKVQWQLTSYISDPQTFKSNTFNNAEIGIEIIEGKTIITNNTFQNMNRGISAVYYSSSPFLGNKIVNNTFNNITVQTPNAATPAPIAWIYLAGSKGDFLQNNVFGDVTYPQTNNPYGIYLDNSSGFSIWDNYFQRNNTGIFVNNSFTGGGTIRNLLQQGPQPPPAFGGNYFTRCSTSVQTNLRNPKLQIRCNQTDNPNLVPGEYGINWFNSGGQLATQGLSTTTDITSPAGNRFNFNSSFPSSNPASLRQIKSIFGIYIYVWPNYIFIPIPYTYYSHDNPQPYIPLGQNVWVQQQPVPCNNFGCCPYDPCLIATNPACRIAQIINIDQQISSLQAEYNTVFANLDKGQTVQLISAINQNVPVPPGDLKNMLLNASPLSDEVLLAFVNRTVAQTPPGIFKDVILPNSPVSDSVLMALQIKLSSLPPGIAKQIQDAQASSTVRTLTAIAREIDAYKTERQYQFNQLLSWYIINDSAEAINLLQQENTVDAGQQLLGTYLAAGNTSAAQAQLASMTAGNAEDQAFNNLYGMLLNLQLQGRSIFQMDSAEEQLVRNIAAMPSSLAQTNACVLLQVVFNENCVPSIIREQEENVQSPFPSGRAGDGLGFLGDNIPNPFNNTTTIPYSLPNGIEKAFINIYDIAGKKISSYEVHPVGNTSNEVNAPFPQGRAGDGLGFLVISSADYENGIYIYKLEVNGATLGSKKMVIIK